MCDTFRKFAEVYAHRGGLDLRFAPMEDVAPSSPVNIAAAGHLKGLRALTAEEGSLVDTMPVFNMEIQSLARMPYWFNVCLHAHRVRLDGRNDI
eukprot:77431-Hanusia_phi.AAC.1